jgi:hypothetical protein
MDPDDAIALLRTLDPAAAKDVDRLVGALAAGGRVEAMLARTPRRPRPRRRLWLLAAAVAAAVVLIALVADPFTRDGTLDPAQAQAQVARALSLQGDWHIARAIEIGGVTATEDAWHASDGRLLVTRTAAADPSITRTTLFAGGERRVYDASSKTLRIHRFVLAADQRDDERAYLPPTAADLYGAAYRLGKVRLAGIETVDGHRVYRLVFDWLGSGYTLIFDAQRQVPISSESRTRGAGPLVTTVTRVRYTAYERVRPGAELDRQLRLPALPRAVRTIREPAIVVPRPVPGASATNLTRQITTHFGAPFTSRALAAHATYALVRQLPGGGIAALVDAPVAGAPAMTRCIALVDITHPGGEAFVPDSGCSTPGLTFASPTRDGRAMIFGGTTNWPRVELRFAGGPVLRAEVSDGLWLATAPSALFRHDLVIVSTNRNGSRSVSRAFSLFTTPGELPGWRSP